MTMLDHLRRGDPAAADLVLLGAPISRASISPSQAWSTPPAFRVALQRFPTWDASTGADMASLRIADAGDVAGDRNDPDAELAHQRVENAVAALAHGDAVVAVVGGDNSLTRPAMRGMMRARPAAAWGLLTLDAHHDCRDPSAGSRNGTPVRELIETGLPGSRIAQIGIHPLANARGDAEWARAHGIHVRSIDEVRTAGIAATVAGALGDLHRAGVDALYVDVDIDVVDRAFAPACPASLPAGMAPADLLQAVRQLGAEPDVAAVDLCEVDAAADVAGMTVRLMAAAFTVFAAGLTTRRRGA